MPRHGLPQRVPSKAPQRNVVANLAQRTGIVSAATLAVGMSASYNSVKVFRGPGPSSTSSPVMSQILRSPGTDVSLLVSD